MPHLLSVVACSLVAILWCLPLNLAQCIPNSRTSCQHRNYTRRQVPEGVARRVLHARLLQSLSSPTAPCRFPTSSRVGTNATKGSPTAYPTKHALLTFQAPHGLSQQSARSFPVTYHFRSSPGLLEVVGDPRGLPESFWYQNQLWKKTVVSYR